MPDGGAYLDYEMTYQHENISPPSPEPAFANGDRFYDETEDFPPDGDCGSRIIYICEPVTPVLTTRVTTELLQYESEAPGQPIHLFIYSPGGCVISGLAIIDTMNHISSPVFTYAIGFAASMGAVILACGQKDHRYILPHSRVMIHQASGTAGGTMDNVRATLAFQSALESETEELLAQATGRTTEEIRAASRVDNWLKASAAVDFGLVDYILAADPTKN